MTLATPSCCCCCCCCLISGAATITFAAIEVKQQRRNSGGSLLAVPLALTAFPLAILAALVAGAPFWYIAYFAVAVAVYTVAHIVAGSLRLLRAMVIGAGLGACGGLLIIADVKLALSDNLLGELVWLLGVPAAILVAARVAKLVTPAVDRSGARR